MMADQKLKESPTHEITTYINIENAKIGAFFLIIGFTIYHGSINIRYGSDSCKWLLSDGRFQGYNAWQPYGCMMHKYTKSNSRDCMHYISYWGGKNHFVFLGDSRIRQLYTKFVSELSQDEEKEVEDPEHPVHRDMHFEDNAINLKVDFLWQPMVNKSMYEIYQEWGRVESRKRPNVVVTGSATWSIKQNNGSKTALENFKMNMTFLHRLFPKLGNKTNIYWMLQDPVIESKLSSNRSMLTNRQIDEYNRATLHTLRDTNSKATLWSSSRLVAQGYNRDSVDGLHLGPVALNIDFQMLVNRYCNDHMNYNDGTCCRSMEPITVVQLITASVFGLSILISAVLVIYQRKYNRRSGAKARAENGKRKVLEAPTMKESKSELFNNFYTISTSIAKLGIIMAYIFICDRTNFFMKENKYYTHVNFFLPFSYFMILGFFFTDDTDQTSILHRDQTDEWKGWMQLVILIYHITGASGQIPIYMQVRVLVSSYLFMTGYGHFIYFWKKGDYGFVRFCSVMFRMNLLVIVLCFVMNRPYQFYYFVPLVSFWFMVVYVVMAIWPHVTEKSTLEYKRHYFYMVAKFLIVVTAMSLLYASELVFEKIFLVHPIKSLFVSSDDSIHEWHFRWWLDRYSVTYGMGFAFAIILLKRFKFIDDSHRDSLFSPAVSWSLAGLSVLGLGGYAVFTSLCRSKQECNNVHAYISLIPIISFVLLRNIPGWLRTRYSSFFAWFGKISLELFISQYHVWLAADTHGVLVLIPSYPVLNICVTSFIFVCVAHEISKLTGVLAKYAVPKDWKSLLRNLIIFLAILSPIAATHGVLGF
ncbi:unnamed protein product [Owenia fusiformis]|uniref:Uncharacterized protein n=1 Tax=Owenia fusiformis TaxID=6347 RepID=A0A8J1UF62_OWEFU|nr:unnamed protein product [Owenia fusiformis]